MRKLFVVCLVFVVAVTFGATSAFAQPSSKVTAKAGGIQAVTLSSNIAAEAKWADVLDPIYIKPPNDKELVMTFSAECGLSTDTTVASKKLARAMAKAVAMVEIRVLVDGDPVIVGRPMTDAVAGLDRDGESVIFARRSQELIANFGGDFSTCDTIDGVYQITDDCLLPEELQLILKTMTANSFTFIASDLEPVEHKIQVQAKLSYDTDTEYNADGDAAAAATAYLGYSSFTIETVRMAKGTNILE